MLIDVHHHWLPSGQLARWSAIALPGQSVRELRPGTVGMFRGDSLLFWVNDHMGSEARLIEGLDRCGVDKAVISASNWLEWLDLALCRELNDAMRGLKLRFPGRILTLAHVPLGEDGALDELERAVSLGVSGVFTIAHVARRGWSLDDARLRPFFERVESLGLPVVVHPACEPLEHAASAGSGPMPLSDHDLLTTCGRPYSTTVSLLRVLLSDLLDRFPRLRFVYPHLGGSFGVMKERLLSRYYESGLQTTLERRLRSIWFDTAPPRWSRPGIRCAVETIGADRIVFGSDQPIGVDYIDRAKAILDSGWFSAEEREKIGSANARELFEL